eukprot:scaffold65282_cov66-Phaeocystis_antarctica.AAC.3
MVEGNLRLREADGRSLCGRQVGVAWQCVRVMSQHVAERRVVVVDHLTRAVAVEWRVHRQHGGQQALSLHDVVDRREHEHRARALNAHRHAAALSANQHPRVDHQLLHLRPIPGRRRSDRARRLLFLRLGFPGVLVHAKAEAALPVQTLRVFDRIQLEPHQPVDAEESAKGPAVLNVASPPTRAEGRRPGVSTAAPFDRSRWACTLVLEDRSARLHRVRRWQAAAEVELQFRKAADHVCVKVLEAVRGLADALRHSCQQCRGLLSRDQWRDRLELLANMLASVKGLTIAGDAGRCFRAAFDVIVGWHGAGWAEGYRQRRDPRRVSLRQARRRGDVLKVLLQRRGE